jgi:nucleotide-binding universal stress UspA family protein
VKGPVICGVDESNVTRGAVEVARDLAERYELPLVYASVIESDEDGEGAEQRLHEAAAPGRAEIVVERGHPSDGLVRLARDREASFLVLGNHGPRSSLLGSISADVARRASCPVVVVPTTAARRRGASASDTGVEGGIVRFAIGHGARVVA